MVHKKEPKFEFLTIPAKVLSKKNISLLEKLIITDIKSLPNGYWPTNQTLADKFGVGCRTIIRAIAHLTNPKLGLVEDVSQSKNRNGRYVRHLRLTEDGLLLFDNGKGVNVSSSKGQHGVILSPSTTKQGVKVSPSEGEKGDNLSKEGAKLSKEGAKVATKNNKRSTVRKRKDYCPNMEKNNGSNETRPNTESAEQFIR